MKIKENKTVFDSMFCAIYGYKYAVRERMFKFHLSFSVFLLYIVAFICRSGEFAVIACVLCTGFTTVAELLNTAIEKTVDLVAGNEYYELAKIAKDVAASAVGFGFGLNTIIAVYFIVKFFIPVISSGNFFNFISQNVYLFVILMVIFIITAYFAFYKKK